jgi:hypothetical protein
MHPDKTRARLMKRAAVTNFLNIGCILLLIDYQLLENAGTPQEAVNNLYIEIHNTVSNTVDSFVDSVCKFA